MHNNIQPFKYMDVYIKPQHDGVPIRTEQQLRNCLERLKNNS